MSKQKQDAAGGSAAARRGDVVENDLHPNSTTKPDRLQPPASSSYHHFSALIDRGGEIPVQDSELRALFWHHAAAFDRARDEGRRAAMIVEYARMVEAAARRGIFVCLPGGEG